MQTLEKFGPKAYKLIKIQLITEIIIPSSEPVQYIVPDIVIKSTKKILNCCILTVRHYQLTSFTSRMHLTMKTHKFP